MNKYTIPNLFKFKNREKISAAVSVAQYRAKDKGYALIVGDHIVDAGRIIVDNLRFISESNGSKLFAEKNNGNLVIADIFSGDCNEIKIAKSVTDLDKKDEYIGYKVPEGYLIKDRVHDLSYIIYAKRQNGRFTEDSYISDAYKQISLVNAENGLRKFVPEYVNNIKNDINVYYYKDIYGNRNPIDIMEESEIDQNGYKILVGYCYGNEPYRYFLTNKKYVIKSDGFDKIIPVNDKYICTNYKYKKNNLGVSAKTGVNQIISKEGTKLDVDFEKYYVLANGDFLIRPLGMKNFKLIDGVTFQVKESDIKNPIVAEKLNIFFAKQKGASTLFGDNCKDAGSEIDPSVAIAVINKLNNKKIPSSVIDYIIQNQIDIEPTLDAFSDMLKYNMLTHSEDLNFKRAYDKSMKEVRNALYTSSAKRIKKYNKQIKDINKVNALTEKFKVALGNSKYVRRKRAKNNAVESYRQTEIDLSEVDGFKQIELDLSDGEEELKK